MISEIPCLLDVQEKTDAQCATIGRTVIADEWSDAGTGNA